MRILVADPVDANTVKALEDEEFLVDVKMAMGKEEFFSSINEYDALIVRGKTKVTAELLGRADNLKLVVRAGAGVDNIDLDAASKKGIYVMNCPAGNTVAVAEHTLALMLSLARRIPDANASLKAGQWEKKKFLGNELNSKTLGIIGLGKIGSRVAAIANSFGMEILAFDPYVNKETAEKLGISLVDKQGLIRQADYISIHTALTPETRDFITAKEMAEMKDGVCIINCARGGIINEDDLCKALESGKIRGAALDVFENEPSVNKNLLSMPNVIVTPHVGGNTEEAQAGLGKMAASQIINAIKHDKYENVVNLPFKYGEIDNEGYVFLKLAERIGRLHYLMHGGQVHGFRIISRGKISGYSRKIAASVLKGFFESFLSSKVNDINAFIIAQERGVRVTEETEDVANSFVNLLHVEALYQKGGKESPKCIAGTIFGQKYLRIVRIGDYMLDFYPDGRIIVMENKDVPGVIGKVATLLGQKKINIAEWRQGKNTKEEGLAMGIINIESDLPDELFGKIKDMTEILNVNYFDLR
ncbi:phosphoglycerate dehydrogenase [Candidatus Woesearchaeota archaeon]|nr:phosphoglycerate dehydrogenase [Candidatus Woesearchaeota archaeon]